MSATDDYDGSFDTAEDELAVAEKCIAKLKEQLAELQERTRWIPVGERLPEEQVKVLTEFDGVIMIDCVQDGRWFLRSFVTYWKPIELPEVVK